MPIRFIHWRRLFWGAAALFAVTIFLLADACQQNSSDKETPALTDEDFQCSPVLGYAGLRWGDTLDYVTQNLPFGLAVDDLAAIDRPYHNIEDYSYCVRYTQWNYLSSLIKNAGGSIPDPEPEFLLELSFCNDKLCGIYILIDLQRGRTPLTNAIFESDRVEDGWISWQTFEPCVIPEPVEEDILRDLINKYNIKTSIERLLDGWDDYWQWFDKEGNSLFYSWESYGPGLSVHYRSALWWKATQAERQETLEEFQRFSERYQQTI